MRSVGIAFSLFFILPSTMHAAVTINEIAWMGDTNSANNEWIELYNSGTSVDLSGWTLIDGDNLTITLSGTIPAQSHEVLERTSDSSAPGSAFLIYTGALKNSGATLTLRRADGSIEDQVSGGSDWSNVGGDNATKETAQYTAGGWVTAKATPGESNSSQGEDEKIDSDDSVNQASNSVSTSGGSSQLAEPSKKDEFEKLVLPDVTLALDIIGPERVFVNQSVTFEVFPSGVGDTIKNSLNYSWNFGDAHTATGVRPAHTFLYPGTYIIHVYGTYARQEASVTKEITVLPIALSLTQNEQQDIQINNDSPYAVDISSYRLRADEYVDMPEHSLLLANQTITIPRQYVQYSQGQMVGLYDAVGTLVASIMPPATKTQQLATVSNEPLAYVSNQRAVTAEPESFQFASDQQEVHVEEGYRPGMYISTSSVPVEDKNESRWPIFALVVLLFLGSMIVLLKPFPKQDSLDNHE